MDKKMSLAPLTTFLIVLAGVGIYAFKMILPFLLALAIGGIMALLAHPFHKWLLTKKLGPRLAGAVTTLFVLVLVAAPLLIFSVLAIKQAINVGQAISFETFSMNKTLGWLGRIPLLQFLDIDRAEIETQLNKAFAILARTATTMVVSMAKNVPDAILQLFLACISCFFFLVDGRRFFRWMVTRLPLEEDVRLTIVSSFRDTAISVVWASMAAAGTQAIVMMVAYLVLGVPAAFLAGGATFIFAWVPILGSTPVWVVGAVYLFGEGSLGKAVAMVAFGLLTGVIDNFVRPIVLKGRGEMHPLVGLVAIFGGIQMFGLFGVLLGPILVAVFISLLQLWPAVGRRYGISFAGDVPTRSITDKA